MKYTTSIRMATLWAVLLATAFLGGCAQKIEIYQYPRFYDPDNPSKNIKSVAVLPFRTHVPQASAAKAGDAMGENVAGLLGASRTYKQVYNRNNLSALLDQQDLQVAMGGDPTKSASAFRKRTTVEALLTGAVTAYASSSRRYPKQVPVPKMIYVGGKPRMTMTMQTIWVTRNEGNVSATATLTRVKNGESIHSTPPLSFRYASEGQAPSYDQHGCLRMAAEVVARQIKDQFAVVRKTVTVGKDAFKTATGEYDGEWEYEKTFKTTDKEMYVVLKLPPSCDRNRFRITIVRKDTRNDLALENIQWKASFPKYGKGWKFDPSEIARKGGGPGKYVAKFYPGPKPKLLAEFKIETPE